MDEIRNSFLAPAHIKGSHESECAKASSTDNLQHSFALDMSTSLDNSVHEESSFASDSMCFEPHPLESSFASCLSSLNETELEFDSAPYFSMEAYFPQEENRKPKSSSKVSTPSRKNSSLQSILKMIRIAPSFKDHKSIFSLIVRASSFKNPISHSSCEDIMKLKTFLLQNAHSSSILREALHRLKEIEPRILPSPHASTEETSPSSKDFAASKDFEKPVDIEHETFPTKGNQPNFITPTKGKKVSFNEDNATRIITP